MKTDKVTRFEIIDHRPCPQCRGERYIGTNKLECPTCHGGGSIGRFPIFHNKNSQIEVQLQDDDRTLKVFITERKQDASN